MNAANEPQLKPASDPAVVILKDGMNQSFVHGFECGRTRACRVILANPGLSVNDLIALVEQEQAPELSR